MSRHTRSQEAENALRHALERSDAERALYAARQLLKFQGRNDLALGTALRLVVLLGRQGHPLFGRARDRWLARARTELTDQHLTAVAEAAFQGLQAPSIGRTCERVLQVVAKDYEWSPTPAR